MLKRILLNLQRLLAFSDEQMQDLMLLRRLYVTRRGVHAMERRALISQTPVSQNQIPLPCDNLTQLSDLASQLKKNAENDYRVYHRVACAARRGVSFAVKITFDIHSVPIHLKDNLPELYTTS